MIYDCIVCGKPTILRKKPSKRVYDIYGNRCEQCWRKYLHEMYMLQVKFSIRTPMGVVPRILLNDYYIYLN